MANLINLDLVKNITFDTTGNWSAIDEAALVAAAASIAKDKSDGSVNNDLASLFFGAGRIAKERKVNTPVSPKAAFDAWRAKHHKRIADTSYVTYLSGFSAFTLAGQHGFYDAHPVAEYAASKVKGGYSDRGAYLRKVLAAFPEVAPTEEQMAALLPENKATTARDVAEEVLAMLTKAFGEKGKHGEALAKNPEADLAAADALAAAQTLVDSLPANPGSAVDHKKRAAEKRLAFKAAQKAAKDAEAQAKKDAGK